MSLRMSWLLVAICLLGLSAPALARNLSAKMWVGEATKVANVQLRAGEYRFVANPTTGEVNVENDYGKVVANVKGDVVKLPEKAQQNQLIINGGEVQEIQFAGQKEAIKLGS